MKHGLNEKSRNLVITLIFKLHKSIKYFQYIVIILMNIICTLLYIYVHYCTLKKKKKSAVEAPEIRK